MSYKHTNMAASIKEIMETSNTYNFFIMIDFDKICSKLI